MRAAVFVLLVGCAAAEPGPPGRFVLAGDDPIVEPERLLVPVDTHPELASARAGDLIAGIQGGGFVRRIVGVDRGIDRDADAYLLATEDIPLGEAVGDAESKQRIAEDGKADGGSRDFRLGFTVANVKLREANGISIELERGSLGFTPTLDLDLEIGGGRLEHFLVHAAGRLDGEISLAASADRGGRWNVARPTWRDTQVYVQWIGWVPVVEVVELSAGVGVDIEAASAFSVDVQASFDAQLGAGVEYDGRWHDLGHASMQRRGSVPAASSNGPVKIHSYLFAAVRVHLYGFAGPYVTVKPHLDFRRDAAGTWTRTVGVSADGGAELVNPFGDDLRYDSHLFDVNYPL